MAEYIERGKEGVAMSPGREGYRLSTDVVGRLSSERGVATSSNGSKDDTSQPARSQQKFRLQGAHRWSPLPLWTSKMKALVSPSHPLVLHFIAEKDVPAPSVPAPVISNLLKPLAPCWLPP